MFKVGDKVKVTYGWWKGETGVVEYLDEYEGQPTYGVKMDLIVNVGEGHSFHETIGDDLQKVTA